jgi:uncharacterized membrane protein
MNLTFCPIDSAHGCTFLWSITPFVELRASIPLGYLEFGLPIVQAVLISILGGVLTAAIVLWLLPWIEHFGKKMKWIRLLMEKVFTKTRHEHSAKMSKLGHLFLILFVAIPLPGSGAWSGVLVSYLFGVPYRKAILLVSAGVILSAIAVAILTLFGHELWKFFSALIS